MSALVWHTPTNPANKGSDKCGEPSLSCSRLSVCENLGSGQLQKCYCSGEDRLYPLSEREKWRHECPSVAVLFPFDWTQSCWS